MDYIHAEQINLPHVPTLDERVKHVHDNLHLSTLLIIPDSSTSESFCSASSGASLLCRAYISLTGCAGCNHVGGLPDRTWQ
jgi:hypothetical protein